VVALKAVAPLLGGEAVYELDDREVVPLEVVRATAKFLSPVVPAMVRLQVTTGMRTSELCAMRPMDIDRSGPGTSIELDQRGSTVQEITRLSGRPRNVKYRWLAMLGPLWKITSTASLIPTYSVQSKEWLGFVPSSDRNAKEKFSRRGGTVARITRSSNPVSSTIPARTVKRFPDLRKKPKSKRGRLTRLGTWRGP